MTQFIWMRHIVAFMTLLFFLVIVDSSTELSHDTFAQKVGVAISAYLFFLLFCKTEGHITVFLLFLIMIQYFLSTYIKTLEQERDTLHHKSSGSTHTTAERTRWYYIHHTLIPRIQMIENSLYTIILFLLVVGVLAYIGKQSTKRQTWVWSNFVFGCGKGCNLQRKFTFGDFTFAELWKEVKLGASKIVRG